MAKIKASTLLRHPDSDEIVYLAEGVDAPAWAEELITNPSVLTQPEPEPDGEGDGDGENGEGEEDSGKEATAPRAPAAKTAPKK